MCKKFSKYSPTFGKNHKIYYLCTALGTYIGMLEQRIVLWCNGSTAVFGSACLGSNPGKTTFKSLNGHKKLFSDLLIALPSVVERLLIYFMPLNYVLTNI